MRGAGFCGPANLPAEMRAFELEPRLEPIPRGNQGKGQGGEGGREKKECPFVQFAKSMEEKGEGGNPSEWSEALFSSFQQAY